MSLFQSMVWPVSGALAPGVAKLLQSGFVDQVRSLLASAITAWQLEDWRRYNDLEAACTTRVLDHLRRLTSGNAEYGLLRAEMETVLTGEPVLAGLADPTTLPRPDIRIELAIGPAVRLIECKRILNGRTSMSAYVDDGMDRFVSGYYPVDDSVAFMIAFIFSAESAEECSARLNSFLDQHPGYGPSTLLASEDRSTGWGTWKSLHGAATQLEILHHLVEIA